MPVLTNVGSAYDTAACVTSRELGIQWVDFTGVTQAVFTVYVNKIGSGTQSWQLWNETDSAQIAVIDDAGAAGVKILSTTVAVAIAGKKLIRVRAKSTGSTDDPFFYGCALDLS